jgi:hypothetical protein
LGWSERGPMSSCSWNRNVVSEPQPPRHSLTLQQKVNRLNLNSAFLTRGWCERVPINATRSPIHKKSHGDGSVNYRNPPGVQVLRDCSGGLNQQPSGSQTTCRTPHRKVMW